MLQAITTAASRPGDARARLALGHAYRDAGSIIEAWGAYREALAIATPGSTEYTEAAHALATLQRQAAREHAAAGDASGARRWLTVAQELDGQEAPGPMPPPRPEAATNMTRARALLALRQPAAAQAALDVITGPRSPAAIALRAEAWLLAGDTVRAERALDRARYLAPADTEVRRTEALFIAAKARALVRQGDRSGALRLLVPIDASRASAEVVAMRARLRREIGDTPGAIADYEAAARQGDAPPIVHAELARLYLANGQLAELAMRYPNAAPNDKGAWIAEARRQQDAGRNAAALAAWARVVAIDPSHAEAWGEAGRLRLEAGDTERAIINLRESIKRGRDQLLATYVEALASAGRKREAEQEIAKALQSPRRPVRPVLEALSLTAARHALPTASRQLNAVLQPAPGPGLAPVPSPTPTRETAPPAPSPSSTAPATSLPQDAVADTTQAHVAPAITIKSTASKSSSFRSATIGDSPVIASRTVPHPARDPAASPALAATSPAVPATGRPSVSPEFAFSTSRTPAPSPNPAALAAARSLSDSQVRQLIDAQHALRARGDTLGAARILVRISAAGIEVSRRELAMSAEAARAHGDAALTILLLNTIRNAGTLTPAESENLGDALALRGDPSGAMEAWEQAMVRPSTELVLKIARALLWRGENERAWPLFERATAIAQSDEDRRSVTIAKGRALVEAGDPEGAVEILEPIKLSRADATGWYALALVRSQRSGLIKTLALRSDIPGFPGYARAELAAAQGDTSAAATLFLAAPPPVEATPAWNTWIDLLASRSNWAAAIDACNTLAAQPGGAAPAARLRARVAALKHDYNGAASWGQVAVRLDPSSLEVRLEAATWLWRAGRSGEAAASLSALVRTLPQGLPRARVLAASGTALLGLGLVDEAARQLAEARTLAMAHADKRLGDAISYNLALAERRRGEPGRALTILDESGRDDLSARLIRAAALIDLERTSEAIAILEASAAASPIATLNYGILLRLNGLPTDSVRVLRYLVEIWSGEALVHFHLAASLEAAGSLPAARASYLAAAENERDTDLAAIFRRQAARLLSPATTSPENPPG